MEESELCTKDMLPLLDRIKSGEAKAREDLLSRIWRRVGQICRKMLTRFPMVRAREETDDVLHPALLKLLKSLNEVRPESTRAFYGLVAEQVRRTLLDLARHYRSARINPGEGRAIFAFDEGMDEARQDTGEALAAAESDLADWELLHAAVAELPGVEREVFSLVFYNGWRQRDIADLFGLSERQVRRHWVAACMRLREGLGPQMPSFE